VHVGVFTVHNQDAHRTSFQTTNQTTTEIVFVRSRPLTGELGL